MVLPILTFGAELWGYEYSAIIENVQLKFCRGFLGVNHSVNISIVLSECGRIPLCVIYKTKVVKYWCKLLRMDNHRFPKQCYMMLKAHADLGRINWVTQIKNVLCTNGFAYAWLSQDIGDIDHFVKVFKRRNSDCSLQNLNESIQNSPRCDLYKHIFLVKSGEISMLDVSPGLRRAFAKFRCSSYKLNIELGRHFNTARDDRVCRHCLLNHDVLVVETEYHCFFYCSLFNAERQTLLFSWYQGRNDIIFL